MCKFSPFPISRFGWSMTEVRTGLLVFVMNLQKKIHVSMWSTHQQRVSAARNKGLEMAKGDWVNFVDSDDTVDKDYLLHLYQAIEGDENDKLIFQGFKMVVSDKDVIYRTFKKHRYGLDDMYLVFQELKMNRSGYPFAKLYSNRIIKANQIRFIEEIHYAEDVMFMLTYMCHIAQVQTVEGANYNYYIRKNANTLSQRIFSFESEYTCYQTYLSRIRVIKERFALPEKSLASVYGVITEYLVRRSIGGLYQKQTRKPKKERLTDFEGIYGGADSVFKSACQFLSLAA